MNKNDVIISILVGREIQKQIWKIECTYKGRKIPRIMADALKRMKDKKQEISVALRESGIVDD